MRICLNSCWFSFDVIGGGEHQFFNTFNALRRAGLSVELFNQWAPKFDSFDLVHFFTVQQGMASFCEYVKNKGLPLALSPIFWPRPDATRGEMWEIEKMFRLADVILPNSQAEAEKISQIFDIAPSKFVVTHNALTPEVFTSGAYDFRSRFSIDGPFLLSVANIERRKNQLRTLQALEIAGIDLPLVCIGNVREPDYHAECLKFGKRYVFLGPMEQKDLADAYSSASCFVLPSTCETPGLAALEAAYLGCRVAITSVGCTEEYLGPYASYVDPYSVDSIAQGIQKALASEAPLGFKEVVLNNFTWDHTARQILAAYEAIRK